MQITSNTKIAQIIKHNPDSIDAIARINKHFKKLKNPILRKLLASRVTIADAAKIGGISVKDFFEILKPLGFEISKETEIASPKDGSTNQIKLSNAEKIQELDVRPILDGGADPFKEIMSATEQLSKDTVLKVINTFEPIPLINLLTKKGFQVEVERPSSGIVFTYLKKGVGGESEENDLNKNQSDITYDFDTVKEKFADRFIEIDVRALEMPEPMVSILSKIEMLPDNHMLYVRHKKFPKYLIPELKQRGFHLIEKRIDEYNIELLIFK